MRTITLVLAVALATGAAPLAAEPTPVAGARKRPVVAKSLTREQIKALGDHEPVDVDGRVMTKGQAKQEIQKAKVQAEAWHQQQMATGQARLERVSAEFRAKEKARVETENIKAAASVAKLRQVLESPVKKEKTPTPCGNPHIADVSTGSNAMYPGMSAFLAGGSCFGKQEGKLVIAWQLDGGTMNPPPHISLWNDHLIVVSISPDVKGVRDQNVDVYVQTADGKNSNKVSVKFLAARDTKLLPSGDTIQICSSEADANDCDPTPGQTFDGVHANSIDFTPDYGVDRIKFNLKNGWKLHSKDWTFGEWLTGGTAGVGSFPVGQDKADITINFRVHPIGYIRYHLWAYIEGPVGVKYK